MKICDYQGFEMHVPTSGGKAGKGKQVTTTLQVRHGNCIKKQFRFILGNATSRAKAIAKAKEYAHAHRWEAVA